MNYRNRALSALLLFATFGSHLSDLGAGLAAWLALAATFFVYPHVVYAIGRRSARPLDTEIRFMLVDAALYCGWVGALGFPAWIGFILVVALVLNLMVFRGLAGMWLGLGGVAVGLAGGWALTRPDIAPATGTLTTALSMLSLFLYLLAFGHDAYTRALQLRRTRDRLRDNEQALQRQLVEIQALQSQLEQQAERDPLTGLYNRRYLTATMDRELARVRREGRPLSLMLIDVDHFKSVNDVLGHQAGDECLTRLATLLRTHARESDVVCRWGGDEFLVLLPTLPCETALERAEAYRQAFERLPTSRLGPGLHATLSIGVACYPDDAASGNALIAAADAALYRAKERGRNRVERGGAAAAQDHFTIDA
jgi:diguanylate cyclase (GGDEF)-like protein